ncbi:hypothetical protein N7447_010508 [Penicillium robsamsonii]|uniref:uncharacterized protein n=1 Tax=Penicillium robsamsonii TaxID=1792511 RepID=UPI0025478188|nr:uncharacterized protein N7447_010508 [Penicillium robsamsonii]KAJ5810992.1 hypothetical protein N7447_010508 [Penicillium robsamsonii]
MARFSLSFISVFLVLAVLALSMPAKRDGQAPSQPLRLDGVVNKLTHATRSTDEDDKDINEKQKQMAKIASKLAEKAGTGSEPTPSATPTSEHKAKFTGMGKIPVIGGVIGDTL